MARESNNNSDGGGGVKKEIWIISETAAAEAGGRHQGLRDHVAGQGSDACQDNLWWDKGVKYVQSKIGQIRHYAIFCANITWG